MKKYALVAVHIVIAYLLFVMACSDPIKSKLQGSWRSKDGKTKLKITDKQFTMDNDGEIPEDYFIKGDTIFTSFEGNQPYTKFVINKLEANKLILLNPDAEAVEFSR
jgi:hypothetical protein